MSKMMFVASVLCAAVSLLIVSAGLASPAHAGPMSFRLVKQSVLFTAVVADGEIGPNTPAQFTDFLRRNGVRAAADIYLNSPGGDLVAGVQLGERIRAAGLNTNVGAWPLGAFTVRPGVCASACTFAYLGGVTRTMERGSRFGVHRFAGGDARDAQQQTQKIAGALVEYISEMGVSHEMYTLMTMAGNDERDPSKRVLWLDLATMARLNITTAGAVSASMTDRQGQAVLILKDGNGGASFGEMDFFCQGRMLTARGYFSRPGGFDAARSSVAWTLWGDSRSPSGSRTVRPSAVRLVRASDDGVVLDVEVPPGDFKQILPANSIWLTLDGPGYHLNDIIGISSAGLTEAARTMLRTTARAC